MEKKGISPRDYARKEGVTLTTVYHKLWAGRIPATKVDGRWLILLKATTGENSPERSDNDCLLNRCPPLVSQIGHLYPGNAHLTPTSPLRRIDEEAILRAVIRDGDKVLAGTEAYALAVKSWSPRERKFITSADKFYNGSEYLKDPAEWERESKPGEPVRFKGPTGLERMRQQEEQAMREAGLIS